MAPLFIAPKVEDEDGFDDVVELVCGHIFCKKNANHSKAMGGAMFRVLSGSNELANFSIFEATRCPICEARYKDEAVSARGADGSKIHFEGA